jgi:hypothetical protein
MMTPYDFFMIMGIPAIMLLSVALIGKALISST